MKLPSENIPTKILVKKEAKTSSDYGTTPEKRPLRESINYGIVNINKTKGPTSHQIADYVKKILEIKKAGHSGTLDPGVTGSLVVTLGNATKVTQVLLKGGKEYLCLMHLHKPVEKKKIKETLEKFIGEITQLPPVKSSVKRQKRQRTVYYIEVLEIEEQDVLFYTGTEAGTYIRKLCLHPSTEILSNSSIISAKDFFANPKAIHTMDNKKIKHKLPSGTQEFNFDGKLIKLIMDSGIEIMITPEHKMLISSEGGYFMKEASKLKRSDYLVKSLKYEIPENNFIISDLLDDNYLVDQPEIKEKVKRKFIKKYGSIREMNRKLGLDRKAFLKKSNSSITIGHIKKSGLYDEIKNEINHFKTQKGIKVKISTLNNDMLYLMGLIASDGNNTKEKGTKRHTRVKFHNKNKKLIELFKRKYKQLFPEFNLSEKIREDGLIELDSSNSFFATICANFGIKSPQKKSDIKKIVLLNKKLIASFLKGYFDGDGSSYKKSKTNNKGNYSKIDYFTTNEKDAKRLHQMLLKLEISNKIFKKSNGTYVISINNLESKRKFIAIIGTNHPLKKEKLKLIKKISSHTENKTYIGFHYKKRLRENKKQLRKLGGNLNRVLNSQVPITKNLYNKAKSVANLPEEDEFCIEKIKNIEKVNFKGKVYDMTVPETHNFLIETGFVSSNCHDIGQELKVGAHMAQLIRTKVGPYNEKTITSLHELKDAYEYYKDGKEKELKKIILPVESAVQHIPKIWILDTTVDSLTHGADLNIPGISKLNEFSKNESVAILTLKGELVSLAESQLSSEAIMKNEKGLAAITKKVFMKPGIYPKIEK